MTVLQRHKDALVEAKTTPEILAAAADLQWSSGQKGECPSDQRPACASEIIDARPETMPEASRVQVQSFMRDLLKGSPREDWKFAPAGVSVRPHDGELMIPLYAPQRRRPDVMIEADGTTITRRHITYVSTPLHAVQKLFVEQVKARNENEQKVGPMPKHPACAIIKWFWERGHKRMNPNYRNDAILPTEVANVRDMIVVAGDPRSTEPTPVQGNLLEGLNLPPLKSSLTGSLPGFELRHGVSPIFPLTIYDTSLEMLTKANRGAGANILLRLWIEILLSVPLAERRSLRKQTADMEIPLRRLIRMLWPNGWGGPGRDGKKLIGALEQLEKAWLPWNEPDGKPGGYRKHVAVFNMPTLQNLNSSLEVGVRLPPGSSGTGPMVHRPSLRLLGTRSAPGYRLLLSAYYFWNRYLTYRGKPLRALVPQVRRDSDSVILDASGQPVADKAGRAVYHWNDKKAIRMQDLPNVRNPEIAQRLPDLTATDLLVMGAPYGIHNTTKQWRHKAFGKVLEAARNIHRDGLFVFEELEPHRRYRIEPPDWWAAPSDG